MNEIISKLKSPLIAAAVTAGVFLLLEQCEEPTPPQIHTIVRTDTLTVTPDTVWMRARQRTVLAPSLNTDSIQALIDAKNRIIYSLMAEREQLGNTLWYADTLVPRRIIIASDTRRDTLSVDDPHYVEFDPYPSPGFAIEHGLVEFELPQDTTHQQITVADDTPWYVGVGLEALKIIAGVVTGYLAAQ